jgi:hypothetical protein
MSYKKYFFTSFVALLISHLILLIFRPAYSNFFTAVLQFWLFLSLQILYFLLDKILQIGKGFNREKILKYYSLLSPLILIFSAIGLLIYSIIK